MALSKSKGKLIASLLYQSWRPDVPVPDISAGELATITAPLLGSGAGALAWDRVRNSHLREFPSATALQQAYRVHALHAAAFEEDIKNVMTLLRSAHVDPVLIKGWAIARLYPDTALRPYGDVDLCVRQSEYRVAAETCESPEAQRYAVDLHRFDRLDGVGADDLYNRSQVVKLGDVDVRVACAEDHLRIISLHMLRHGAWRPIWLYDIAVALQTRTAGFDWDLCLGRSKRIAHWIICTIGLAHQLLGAGTDDTPLKRRAEDLPSWLIPNVLKQWEQPFARHHGVGRYRAPMARYLRHPSGMIEDLRRRWPDPIEATVYTHGPFNEFPRLAFQIGECIGRTAKFLSRLPNAVREGR